MPDFTLGLPVMALNARTVIERNRLFRGLPSDTLDRIASLAQRRVYSKGETIFAQADPGDGLYGVVTGRVRISASSAEGKELFLNIMEPGDTFGEIALLDGRPRTATATTTAASDLVVIPRDSFMGLLRRESELVTHVLELLCQRVRWLSGLTEDSALLPVPARLARRLLTLGKMHGQNTAEGVRLSISQEEMARFVGLSRQVVNQYLQSWKARQWVDLGRSNITIIDPDALQFIVANDAGDAS
jgi:CRP/FNR family cyclic AMP-dependent transcriptional regulator